MTQYLFSRRSLSLSAGIAVVLGAFAATPALAAKAPTMRVDTSACAAPPLSQPFASVSDLNWYTLAPGQTPGNFTGAGWTLTGGARIITTLLQNGQTGLVLDLPGGSTAVSPAMCVTSAYPTARMMVRDVAGSKKGVQSFVSYAGTKSATKPQKAGAVQGSQSVWTLSAPINVNPGTLPGWQLVQFTLVGDKGTSDIQLYNFYVDPRAN